MSGPLSTGRERRGRARAGRAAAASGPSAERDVVPAREAAERREPGLLVAAVHGMGGLGGVGGGVVGGGRREEPFDAARFPLPDGEAEVEGPVVLGAAGGIEITCPVVESEGQVGVAVGDGPLHEGAGEFAEGVRVRAGERRGRIGRARPGGEERPAQARSASDGAAGDRGQRRVCQRRTEAVRGRLDGGPGAGVRGHRSYAAGTDPPLGCVAAVALRDAEVGIRPGRRIVGDHFIVANVYTRRSLSRWHRGATRHLRRRP